MTKWQSQWGHTLRSTNRSSWKACATPPTRGVTTPTTFSTSLTTASGKPIAKVRSRQKPTVTLTSVSIPFLQRKWIDIETQRSHDHKCCEVSKAITRLLRHDQSVPRGSDGAIHCSDIIDECRGEEFEDASQWLLEDWISTLARGGGAKEHMSKLRESKIFQSIPVPSSNSRTFRK